MITNLQLILLLPVFSWSSFR